MSYIILREYYHGESLEKGQMKHSIAIIVKRNNNCVSIRMTHFETVIFCSCLKYTEQFIFMKQNTNVKSLSLVFICAVIGHNTLHTLIFISAIKGLFLKKSQRPNHLSMR
jgi:hypothetical protein